MVRCARLKNIKGYQNKMIEWLKRISLKLFAKKEVDLVRARDDKGRFVWDDESTPDVNEAYVEVPRETSEKK